MRSLLGALAVLVVSGLLVSSAVLAGPPVSQPARAMRDVIAELERQPQARAQLAAARFDAEVFGATTVEGSSSTVTAMLRIHQRGCDALSPAELKAASALLSEFGDALPVPLRAYTLGQQGKGAAASSLLAAHVEALTVEVTKGCPAEHPAAGGARLWMVEVALQCMRVFTPQRDLTAQQKLRDAAQRCAASNHAAG